MDIAIDQGFRNFLEIIYPSKASRAELVCEYAFYGDHKPLSMKSKKTEYGANNAAIKAAKRFWAKILCKLRV